MLGQNWLSVAPTILANWGNTMRNGRLVKTTRGGPNHPTQRGRCGTQVSPSTWTSSPVTPGWGRAHPGAEVLIQGMASCHCQCHHCLSTGASWRSRTLPLHTSDWIDWCTRHTQMLSWWEELSQIPSHVDHQKFTQKVHTSFKVPKACMQVRKVGNHYMPLPAPLPCHQRTWGLVPRKSVLANCIILSPMQGLCSIGLRRCIPQSMANHIIWRGVYRKSGRQWSCTSLLKRGEVSCDHGAVQLDGSNLAPVDGDCATRILEESHLKQLGLPERIPVCDPQQMLACYCSQVSHHNSGYTGNSTTGVYATPACIWLPGPVPAIWVHRNYPDPA